MSEIDLYLSTAQSLATQAQAIAQQTWSQNMTVEYKSDGSSLTSADLAIETLWRETIRQMFPTHGILGEEFGADTGSSAYTWVLDPIDGTRPFGAGLLNYASLIGLCRDGEPILGLISLPQSGMTFVAAEGRGTYFAGHCLKTSGATNLKKAVISLANPDSFSGVSKHVFQSLSSLGRTRVYDSGSPAYGALARGLIDVCLNGDDLDAFDICALCPIVIEAGGVITDLNGSKLSMESKGAILASASKALHDKVLSL